ncbi:unnamed protein product [Fusarium venenatum]|uniref:Uncharacterized protein n=1 Tax=Fusarium venenatum TaxID=56646 RepID=A0A2L2TST6_9HYPO|nr:uncharacterized protein FVRRES_03458 [Fusarium venenatum]CEI66946.1 unnamed protein product [Fusarium venenatum]
MRVSSLLLLLSVPRSYPTRGGAGKEVVSDWFHNSVKADVLCSQTLPSQDEYQAFVFKWKWDISEIPSPSLPDLAQLQTDMKRIARRWVKPIESGAMGRGVRMVFVIQFFPSISTL